MGAADASPSEAIEYLETNAPTLLDAVFSGACVPFFGSGISAGRLPNVPSLLLRALVALFELGKPGDGACPYFSTLQRIISLAGRTSLDPTQHPTAWDAATRDQLLSNLTGQYAAVLAMSVPIPGSPVSVRWDILDLIGTYSDPRVEPDAEHAFIAFLVEEGVFPDMVTTNWDPLIERADAACASTPAHRIHSIACNEELDTAAMPDRPRLYKIHGCAEKARGDPTHYKAYLVATQLDLGQWTAGDSRRPFREALSTLLRQRSVIFLGLSGQDFNLQVQIVSATLARTAFDPAAPRAMFCATNLTPNHTTILSALYGETEYLARQGEIDRSATVQLYGKPLLGALCLELLFEKASLLIEAGINAGAFRASTASFLRRSLGDLKTAVLTHFDSVHDSAAPDESWRQLHRVISSLLGWFVAVYRRQEKPPTALSYESLLPGTIAAKRADGNVPLLNYHWLMWSILVMFAGLRSGRWQLNVSAPSVPGTHPLQITVNGTQSKIFIIGDDTDGLAKLIDSGQIDFDGAPSSVFYPRGRKPAGVRRSPARRLPTGARTPFSEIWMGDLYEEAVLDDDVLDSIQTLMV